MDKLIIARPKPNNVNHKIIRTCNHSQWQDGPSWTLSQHHQHLNLPDVVDSAIKKPEKVMSENLPVSELDDVEAWNKIKNVLAGTYVCANSVSDEIRCGNGISDDWRTLGDFYARNDDVDSLFFLKEKFSCLNFSDEHSIEHRIVAIELLAGQLRNFGEQVCENDVIAKIIYTLPSGLRSFVTVWNCLPDEVKSLSLLKHHLLVDESFLNDGYSLESLLCVPLMIVEEVQLKSTPRPYRHGHRGGYSGQHRSESRPHQRPRCEYCFKMGHTISTCRNYRPDGEGNQHHQRVTCDYCNAVGHDESTCRHRIRAEKYKNHHQYPLSEHHRNGSRFITASSHLENKHLSHHKPVFYTYR